MNATTKLRIATPSDRKISIARNLSDPRSVIFDAWARPELIEQWLWGPDEWPLIQCNIELNAGGRQRWAWGHIHDGKEMGLSGVYRESVHPERIVHTELFDEDWRGGDTLITTVFSEQHGKTTVTTTIRYSSSAARDGALNSGTQQGMAASYSRLD